MSYDKINQYGICNLNNCIIKRMYKQIVWLNLFVIRYHLKHAVLAPCYWFLSHKGSVVCLLNKLKKELLVNSHINTDNYIINYDIMFLCSCVENLIWIKKYWKSIKTTNILFLKWHFIPYNVDQIFIVICRYKYDI